MTPEQTPLREATYIKVKEGKLLVSDMHGFLQEFYPSKPSKSIDTTEAFKKSFIEVGNPEVALSKLKCGYSRGMNDDDCSRKDCLSVDGDCPLWIKKSALYWGDEESELSDEIIQIKDGLYPISGLQFEVREEPEYVGASESTSYPTFKKVAIVSLKQETIKTKIDMEDILHEWESKQEQPFEEKEDKPDMTPLERIKDEVKRKSGFNNLEHGLDSITKVHVNRLVDECMKRYAKYALEKAAENATTIAKDHMSGELYPNEAPSGYDVYYVVDKDSILNCLDL